MTVPALNNKWRKVASSVYRKPVDSKIFGSFVISNIGSVGLDTGYPALFHVSNVAMVFIMGGVLKKPVVVNDQVVIRRMISLSCALDHRVVDANHGGLLFKSLKQSVRNPELFEGSAREQNH